MPRPYFWDLHLSISDGIVKTKIYDKRDDFDFDIVNFPFLHGVPRSAFYVEQVRNPSETDSIKSQISPQTSKTFKVFIFLNLFNLLECPVMFMT